MTRTVDAGTTRPALPGYPADVVALAESASVWANGLYADHISDSESQEVVDAICNAIMQDRDARRASTLASGETRKPLEAARDFLQGYAWPHLAARENAAAAIVGIDAALASEDVRGWRTDMENAPKDGSPLMIWVEDGIMQPHCFAPISITDDGAWWDDATGDRIEPVKGAKAWQPAPNAPETRP